MSHRQQYWLIKFPDAATVVVEPMLASRSWRKACKSLLVAVPAAPLDVPLVPFDELPGEAVPSAETRLLKSVCRVLMLPPVAEATEDEPSDPVPSCEISCSSLLEKVE